MNRRFAQYFTRRPTLAVWILVFSGIVSGTMTIGNIQMAQSSINTARARLEGNLNRLSTLIESTETQCNALHRHFTEMRGGSPCDYNFDEHLALLNESRAQLDQLNRNPELLSAIANEMHYLDDLGRLNELMRDTGDWRAKTNANEKLVPALVVEATTTAATLRTEITEAQGRMLLQRALLFREIQKSPTNSSGEIVGQILSTQRQEDAVRSTLQECADMLAEIALLRAAASEDQITDQIENRLRPTLPRLKYFAARIDLPPEQAARIEESIKSLQHSLLGDAKHCGLESAMRERLALKTVYTQLTARKLATTLELEDDFTKTHSALEALREHLAEDFQKSMSQMRIGSIVSGAISGLAFILLGALIASIVRSQMRVLRAAQDFADSANRSKSEFLANMSHEIRTPLTAMLGYTDILREEPGEPDVVLRRKEMLDTMSNAGKHLLTLINDILDLSMIEAGKLQIKSQEMSLPGLLSETLQLFAPRMAAKNLYVRCELKDAIPENIMGYPTQLRQVLMNLVGNALKFTEAGGVTLRISQSHPGNVLFIDVVDTGVGIPASAINKLFQPFSQVDNSSSRRHGGAGLGLVISRRLAEMMGGSISIQSSTIGSGTCFRFTLPTQPMPGTAWIKELPTLTSDRTPSSPVAAPTTLLSGHVLFAEDGLDNQHLISFILERAGLKIDVVDNGKIALDKVEEAIGRGQPYDLLITDMQMPEMDGYTLAMELRLRGIQLPIIALTAHAMAEDRARCIDAGCNDYISKPVNRQALISMCQQWLKRAPAAVSERRAA